LAPERAIALERALSAVISVNLPKPLYRGNSHWGDTAPTPNGVIWVGRGFLKKPEFQYADKNHGIWRKYEVDLESKASQPLKLKLENPVQAGNNTLSFDLHLDVDLHFKIEQENWQHGIKFFDGAARGNLHFMVMMKCESKLVIEPGESFLPVMKYRFRVVQARPNYSNLKFTHVPGLGGEVAEKLGRWGHEALQQIKPSVERKLMDKLTQRILKAADTKEVQLSLSGIERKK